MYCNNEYEAAENSDAIVLITEWNQFRRLDLDRLINNMNDKYFFDFRNVYERETLERLGFIYNAIGR